MLGPRSSRPWPSARMAGAWWPRCAADCGRARVVAWGWEIHLWDIVGQRVLASLRAPQTETAHSGSVSHLAVSSDGRVLLSASDDTKHVRVWGLGCCSLLADLWVGGGTCN